MPLLDELAVGGVEDAEIELAEVHRFLVRPARLVQAVALLAITGVGRVQCADVRRDRQWSVHDRVLRVELGLVEVVCVGHVRPVNGYATLVSLIFKGNRAPRTFEDERRVRSN